MFAAFGRFVYRFRWPTIAVWVVILLVSLLVLLRFSTQLESGGFSSSDMESEKALNVLRQNLQVNESSATVIFTDDNLTVDDASYQQAVEATAAHLKEVAAVKGVKTLYNSGDARLASADRHTTYATVSLEADSNDPGPVLDQLRQRLGSGPPRAILTGDLAVYQSIDQVAHNDLVRAETFALPISLIVLLFVFGSVVSAGLPVTMGGIAVAATLGVLYLLARVVDVSIFSMNIVSMLGLGLGIDYSLLLVSRFREELGRDGNVSRSVMTTAATAGKTVFFSGATVFIGLSGLLVYPLTVMRSLAYGGTIVVVLSVLAALTLVPALLGVLGPRVNALALRRIRHTRSEGFWHHLADQVMKHPVVIFVVTLFFIFSMASPFLRAEFGIPSASELPASSEARQGDDLLNAKFGAGETSPILVVLESDGNVLSQQNVGAAFDLTKKLASDPRVQRVDGLFSLDPSITREQYQAFYANQSLIPNQALKDAIKQLSSQHVTVLDVISKDSPTSASSRELVKEIRATQPGGDLRLQVSGVTAISLDIEGKLFGDFPLVIGIIGTATFIALLILFRSIVLPLKAVLMNGLSVLASFGALVFVFQEGHFSHLLGFTPPGFIDSTAPIMLFCIIFGLSMDYEVFLLTRIKEAYDRTGDNTESVAEGLEWTGSIITSAAAIMVVVTGSFAATDLLSVKSMGLGAGVAIFLDATIVRALLVPATMRLLGNWNWWAPRFLKGRVPKVVLD